MNVLVTGGAGYVGAELVFALSKLPKVEKIVVYDNLSRGNYNLFISSSNKMANNKVTFVMGDLLDSRKLKNVMKGIDVVYHLAAKVATPYQDVDSHFFEQINHWGTAELVYAIEESDVSKFVYMSSTGVYGGTKKKKANEKSEPNPRTFYAISKMRGEGHVERLMKKMDTYIIRCGNVYGYSPCIRFDSVINRFLFDANFNNRIQIHGSGKQSRAFININKVVQSLTAFVNRNDIPADTYNLVDQNYMILDLVDIFKEVFPELEFIFINQHLELRDLQVDLDTRLSTLIPMPKTELKEELIDIRDKSFAFSSSETTPAGPIKVSG